LSKIFEKIAGEIGRNGAISFARFMELALYCPDCGYYEKEKDNVGRGGDFFTSVSVGGLFGELLAFQFGEWAEAWKTEGGSRTSEARIVEAGAHDGRLAKDILASLRGRWEEIFDRLEYYILEPSERRREWQRKTLEDFTGSVRWARDIPELAATLESSRAIIFSNELLDAMPVRRLGWDAKAGKWFEWGVTLEGKQFVWCRMPVTDEHVLGFTFDASDFQKLLEVLPDGFTTEISPAAEAWWREAAGVLKEGKLLAIDYGMRAEEFFAPERKTGTLRAYHRHHLGRDILANPGEQDITAHVNFTAVQNVGEAAGLKTEAFVSQAKFLTQIAERTWKRADVFGEWDSGRTRQFQTLTHPEHLGRPFRVLIQSRQSGD
jgi:SAM-dependent MidA family methyltransferase